MRIRVVEPTIKSKSKRLRVCAYVRVFTDSAEQENSLDNQSQYFIDFINANPEWQMTKIYADQGISGYKDTRPQFQQMIRDAKAGKIDLIVVKSISRFARNTLTMLKVVRELKARNVGAFFQLQNINTLTTTGELLMTIQAAFAQAESESASVGGRMIYKRKFEQGIRTAASEKTFGYKLDASGDLNIVPTEANLIRLIFDMADKNIHQHDIVNYLNKHDIPAIQGGLWNDTGVSRILRNEMYKGTVILQKTHRDALRRIHPNRGEEDMWVIGDDHPAIVSEEQWERVQQILKNRLTAHRAKNVNKTIILPKQPIHYQICCTAPIAEKSFCTNGVPADTNTGYVKHTLKFQLLPAKEYPCPLPPLKTGILPSLW